MASSCLLEQDGSTCLGIKFVPKIATELKFADIYAVELTDNVMIQESNLTSTGDCFLGNNSHDSEVCFLFLFFFVPFSYNDNISQ